ncbi:MAG: ankyrin repeat domain-containing protein [Methylacidiphilales bacterium]|nr:ankyrin repeat domain-containing protein [Candidatus Methylacidiphilales bacterium]
MIPLFLHNLELIFFWLLAASWQASVLALIVLAVQTVLRGRLNPRWRYALWLLVVLRLVMPALPESALSLFQFAPTPSPVLLTPVTEPLFAPAAPISPAVATPLTEPSSPLTLYSLLAMGWLAGAVILLILTWEANRRFARQMTRSPEITDPALLDLFLAAKAELEVRRPIRLVENGQVQSPAIMGLFSPTLLLPGGVRDRFDATELRLIFLHELAHLKRGDVIVQGLIALLQILHWFNPVLWYAFRRMRIDREPATDALVLSRAGEAEKERYGLMLIKLLEHFNQRHSLPTLVGILEDKDQFKRRFSLIAKFTRGAYGWSLLGILLIGILSVACLTKSKSIASPSDTKALAKISSEQAKPNGQQLIDAAGREDIPEMTRLLNLGTDVNYREKDGWTPITRAVESNKAGSVKFLLAHGADSTHGLNDNDQTLLFNVRSPEVAEILIQHGVDVNARSKSGETALDRLCMFAEKPAEVARVLLKHGADPNARDNYGSTPLMFASDGATVDLLIDHGADIKAKNKYGVGVLHNPRGDASRLQALIRHGAPFDPKTDGPTLMMEAAWFDHVDVIAYLLSLGVDPNQKGTWNEKADMYFTPLQQSVISGHLDAAKFLLEHGAKFVPHLFNGKPGPDEMVNALYNRRKDIVRLFWEHGMRSISELTYAISQGEPVGAVQKLLDGGIPPDPPQDKFMSPLALAAELGQLDVVTLLVQRGAKINGHVAPSVTPIDQAAMEGQDEVVDYLLRQGAQVDYQALYNAIWNSYPGPDQRSKDHFERTAKLLIDAGALKTTTSEQNGQILVGAIDTRDPGGNTTVLKMLLEAGLSPESPMPYLKNGEKPNSVIGYYRDFYRKNKDDPSNGPFAAMIKPFLDMLEAADKSATPKADAGTNATDANAQMPQAVQKGDAATVQKLIDQGADPKAIDKYGRTLLFDAGSPEVAEILIAHGVDPNARDQGGHVALFNLCQNGSKDVTATATVRVLLDHGADFDPKGQSGATALGFAAASNDVKLMKFLMDRGVSPNAHGAENQDSPLGMAAFRSPEAVKLLLERGADPEGYSHEGMSPLAAAIMFNKTENANLLRAAGAHDVGDLSAAVAAGDNAKVAALLHDGANVNETDRAGNTPLLYAVRRGQVDMAKLLLAHGANINQFSFGGLTPTDSLDEEANSGRPDQAQLDWGVSQEEGQRRLAAFKALFLNYPPDPNYRDSRGRTALHQAAFSGNVFLPMGDKAHPVDPNIRDHDGNTPLLLAALSPHVKYTVDRSSNSQAYIVNRLLKAGAKLDLVMANGKTVGEMAMAAAVKANNPQLISVLHDAGVAEPASPPESPDQGAGTNATNAVQAPTLNVPKFTLSLPPSTTTNTEGSISQPRSPIHITPTVPLPPNPNNGVYYGSVTVVTVSGPMATPVNGGDKDTNAINTVGNPALAQALIAAIKQDDLAEVERLLKQGAKLSESDVLVVAATKNQKLVQLLRQYKSLPISDLAWAVLENRSEDEIVEIEEKEAEEAKEKIGLPLELPDSILIPTLFHPNAVLISRGDKLSILEFQLPLHEIGDLSIFDDSTVPLPVAALMGDLPTVELLLQNGVNPNALPWTNWSNPWLSVSPLSLAALAGHDDVVVYLLQHGAKAHFNDIACVMQGWPSASRSQETRENTVKLMIATGALKNITEEQTAFLFESSFRSPEWNLSIVKLLLDAGLNPNARSADPGKTVIDLTKERIDQEAKYSPEWETKYHFQRNTKPLLELLENAASNANVR